MLRYSTSEKNVRMNMTVVGLIRKVQMHKYKCTVISLRQGEPLQLLRHAHEGRV